MTTLVYDAGALVAAERRDDRLWALHRRSLERGITPVVPATALMQVSRSSRQWEVRQLLAGCDVADLDEDAAHAGGRMLAKAGTDDVADAHVVFATLAGRDRAVVTSDRGDLEHLARSINRRLAVIDI
ncbi:MAG: twitching motility protein PilT [Sporichthyaceae bacterium]